MTEKIYQKELSITEILSLSWKIFTENFGLILHITLIIYIPINIILTFIPIEDSFEGIRKYIRVIQILEGLIGIIVTMAIAYIVKKRIDGEAINIEEAFKKSFSKWFDCVLTNIIFGILIVGLTLLLIVPGIIYSIYWIFSTYAVVLNNKSGKDALNYSKSIVKGRWKRVALYCVVFGILALTTGLIASIPFLFIPESYITNILLDSIIDITASFFIVLGSIFFINFDATKEKTIKSIP